MRREPRDVENRTIPDMINFCSPGGRIAARRTLKNVLQTPACLSIPRGPVSPTVLGVTALYPDTAEASGHGPGKVDIRASLML
jgi:hypothetical protein